MVSLCFNYSCIIPAILLQYTVNHYYQYCRYFRLESTETRPCDQNCGVFPIAYRWVTTTIPRCWCSASPLMGGSRSIGCRGWQWPHLQQSAGVIESVNGALWQRQRPQFAGLFDRCHRWHPSACHRKSSSPQPDTGRMRPRHCPTPTQWPPIVRRSSPAWRLILYTISQYVDWKFSLVLAEWIMVCTVAKM